MPASGCSIQPLSMGAQNTSPSVSPHSPWTWSTAMQNKHDTRCLEFKPHCGAAPGNFPRTLILLSSARHPGRSEGPAFVLYSERGEEYAVESYEGEEKNWMSAYRIFFPNAERLSSTARSAVRLCSSMTGLTSTISNPSMRAWSAIISMAR